LLEQFRQMLNDCIRIGLTENVTSLKSLSLKAYRQLSGYDVVSYKNGSNPAGLAASLGLSAYALRTFGVDVIRRDFVGSKREMSPNWPQ
jgi:hypothetical protein